MQTLKTRTSRALLLGAFAAALTLSAAPIVRAQPNEASARTMNIPTLNVRGEGVVQAAPDRATVRLGAQAQGKDATSAQARVNAVLQAAIARIRALGIEEKRIRTENLSLYPIYENQKPGEESQPKIVGYRASNILSVEVDNMTRAGSIIDTGLAAGINTIEGVSFDLKNDDAARASAMEKAVQQARSKAETLARALGMQLDGVLEVTEGGVDVRPPQPMMYGRMAMAEMASTPVQPGEMNIEASVVIRYRIK